MAVLCVSGILFLVLSQRRETQKSIFSNFEFEQSKLYLFDMYAYNFCIS